MCNVSFYINDYLLYYDAYDARSGCSFLSGFFGSWFTRKSGYASEGTARSNIASIKKFNKFMLSIGEIYKCDYDNLVETIRELKEEWFEEVDSYRSEIDSSRVDPSRIDPSDVYYDINRGVFVFPEPKDPW